MRTITDYCVLLRRQFSRRIFRALFLSTGAWLLAFNAAVAADVQTKVNVLTYHNDLARTGQNLNETVLTPANVNTNNFGKLFSQPVDGEVYGQPLYVSDLPIPGKGTHNVVFVVTQHDSVYAFDADSNTGENASPLWHVSFINPSAGINSVHYSDIIPDYTGTDEVGISSTPVIDGDARTLYVVAKTKEVSNGVTSYAQRLHALDLATGAEKLNGPVTIQAVVRGTGDGANTSGNIPFNPLLQHQRSGLVLLNGVVYICWASVGDVGPYHGWVIGYDAQTLQQVAVFNTTPRGYAGGIWMSGAAPSADADGNIYAVTGNGTFGYNLTADYGDTALKLSTKNGGLAVADYFTPFNQVDLDFVDADLGSGGALVLPDQPGPRPHLLVFASKEAKIYVLDRDNMGHFQSGSDSQIVQSIPDAIGASFGMPAYFDNRIYYLGFGDVLKVFALSNGRISSTPIRSSSQRFGYPGATPCISATGTNNAIVWALETTLFATGGSAVLHAYDANDVSRELYNSAQTGGRDAPGPAVRFTLPTVANGKVYVGTGNALAAFGLRTIVATPTFTPNGGAFDNSVTVKLATSTPGADIYYTLDGSNPTQESLWYTDPFTLTNSTRVAAKAFKNGSTDSDAAASTFVRVSSIGTGTGLNGGYFGNQTKTFDEPPTFTRKDATLDFNWPSGSPDSRISSNRFTVRWTGFIQAQFTEPYTFYTLTDDGVRLWVNDELIIDHWVDQLATEWSGTISLIAGPKYAIRMEYYNNGGTATARLSWSGPSTPKVTIPQSQLYPILENPSQVSLLAPTNGAQFIAPVNITLKASATASDGFVQKVEFFQNDVGIGETEASPYSVVWDRVEAGVYILTAKSTDYFGIVTTSQPVTIAVAAPSLQIAYTDYEVVIAWATSSVDYILEVTDDLTPPVNWKTATEIPVVDELQTSIEIDPASRHQFYRLRSPAR